MDQTSEVILVFYSLGKLLKSSPAIAATPPGATPLAATILAAIAGVPHLQSARAPSYNAGGNTCIGCYITSFSSTSATISRLFYRYLQIETILHLFETIGNAYPYQSLHLCTVSFAKLF